MKRVKLFKIAFFGDEIEKIIQFDPLTGEILDEPNEISIYPAKHYITQEESLKSRHQQH